MARQDHVGVCPLRHLFPYLKSKEINRRMAKTRFVHLALDSCINWDFDRSRSKYTGELLLSPRLGILIWSNYLVTSEWEQYVKDTCMQFHLTSTALGIKLRIQH